MRIGIDLLSESGASGLTGTYADRLVESLVRSGDDDLELYVFTHDDFPWSFPIDDTPGLTVISSGHRGIPVERRAEIRRELLPALAERHSLDLVHSVSAQSCPGLQVPWVATVRRPSSGTLDGDEKLATSLQQARLLIVSNLDVRQKLSKLLNDPEARRLRLIQDDLETTLDTDVETPEAAQASYHLPPDFVLYVGGFLPASDQRILATAASAAANRDTDEARLPWVLAGISAATGRRLESLSSSRWSRAIGVVGFGELIGLCRMARVVVVPSCGEEARRLVPHALAAGVPTLTPAANTTNPAAARAILPIDPASPTELVRKAELVLKNESLRTLMRLRSRNAVSGVRWGKVAAQTIDAYRAASRCERDTPKVAAAS